METQIKDGSSGKVAKVDGENRLWVFSPSLQHYESHEHGHAFLVNLIKYADGTQWKALTTTGGPVMILNNNSTKVMVLTRILGSVTGGAMFWMHRFTSAQTPAANNRDLDVFNLNFGVTNHTDIVAHGWDGVGDGMTGLTLNDQSGIAQLYVPAGSVINLSLNDNWVIPANSSLVAWAGGVGGTPNLCLLFAGYLHADT